MTKYGIFTFPVTKAIAHITKNSPRRCFAWRYLKNAKYSYYILTNSCDCNIWCKYPPSTTLKRL